MVLLFIDVHGHWWVYGVLFLVYALGGVAGPVLYGFAFDSFGGYSAALHAGAVACLACAGAVIGLGPYSYRSEAVTH